MRTTAVGPSLLTWWLGLALGDRSDLGFGVEVVMITVDGVAIEQIWLEIHNNSDHILGLEDDVMGSVLSRDGDRI
jgi:hypothetical protein